NGDNTANLPTMAPLTTPSGAIVIPTSSAPLLTTSSAKPATGNSHHPARDVSATVAVDRGDTRDDDPQPPWFVGESDGRGGHRNRQRDLFGRQSQRRGTSVRRPL